LASNANSNPGVSKVLRKTFNVERGNIEMRQWSAVFVNDPYDDYNLIVEILCDDEIVAIIRNVNEEIILQWYSKEDKLEVPVDWLLGLLTEAKRTLEKQDVNYG
jgi:hypothetical protein